MSGADARFEDGAEAPLYLKALDAEGVQTLSALVQDAVFPASEMKWQPRERRLALFINRFRWEDREAAERQGRAYERVQSLLVIEDVMHVASQGVTPGDADTVLSLLALSWEPGEDGMGRLVLTLAGDGAIAASVECIDVTLRDVTRPYLAPSHKAPKHPE